MKAMIFAAGLGTRLRPLTNDRPKALVCVAGKPMLQHVIERVRDAGFDDITVNVHHFADKVIEFLEQTPLGVTVHISDERDLVLETGGGILKARQWLDGDEPFLVHNADILTDFDLQDMYKTHCRSKAIATLLVKPRTTQRYFLFNQNNRLRGWINVATGETRPAGIDPTGLQQLAFGGVHVISPAIFPLLEKEGERVGPVFSTTPFYIDICRKEIVNGYQPNGAYNWFDVGKPETLAQAEDFLNKAEKKE